jgi:hypothetical protein
MRSKGQFSTYLKPIVLIMFAILVVLSVNNVLQIRADMQQESEQIDFRQEARKDVQKIVECLKVNKTLSGNSYILNQSRMTAFHLNYSRQEPPCAEDLQYGYNVTVRQNFLHGVTSDPSGGGPADIIFAIDDSGSMSPYINAVKDNVRNFMTLMPAGSRVGMFTYATPPSGNIANEVALTTDVTQVESELSSVGTAGGSEPEGLAIKHGLEMLSDGANDRQIIILIATEPASRDQATSKSPQEWAQDAADQGVQVFTVADNFPGYKQIAETTDAKHFHVSEDFSKIFGEIARSSQKVGGDTTCTLPPVKEYNGKVDLVFAADTSNSFTDEWEDLCGRIDSTRKELSNLGLELNVSVYVPGQELPDQGHGTPAVINGAKYGLSNVPECVTADDDITASSSLGQGITTWNGKNLTTYDPSTDYGLEGWGVFSKWILENHEWSEDADKRILIPFGDHDPTGGMNTSQDPGPGSTWRTDQDDTHDSEVEIANNVTSLAAQKEVTLFPIAGDLEYQTDRNNFGTPSKNDAVEIMQTVADQTNGKFFQYDQTKNLAKAVESGLGDLASVDAKSTCTDQTFSFGAQKGSRDKGLNQKIQFIYPVTVWHTQDLQTPATLAIQMRDGDLETFVSRANSLVKEGRRKDEIVEAELTLTNEQRITSTRDDIEYPEKTEYKLVNSQSGSDQIQVDDDLILGINGYEKVGDRNGTPSTIDFSDDSNHFTAYDGATLQLIAINKQDPALHLDPVALECANTNCGTQPITTSEISASKNTDPEAYQELGGKDIFYHNFTQVTIGPTTTNTKQLACIATSEGENCEALRADLEEDIDLRPGTHVLHITYNPTTDQVTVNE